VCPWHGWHWNGDGTNAADPVQQDRLASRTSASRPTRSPEWYGFNPWCGTNGTAAPRTGSPGAAELETDDYYPLHPHNPDGEPVKVHAQMIIEKRRRPVPTCNMCHKAANPDGIPPHSR